MFPPDSTPSKAPEGLRDIGSDAITFDLQLYQDVSQVIQSSLGVNPFQRDDFFNVGHLFILMGKIQEGAETWNMMEMVLQGAGNTIADIEHTYNERAESCLVGAEERSNSRLAQDDHQWCESLPLASTVNASSCTPNAGDVVVDIITSHNSLLTETEAGSCLFRVDIGMEERDNSRLAQDGHRWCESPLHASTVAILGEEVYSSQMLMGHDVPDSRVKRLVSHNMSAGKEALLNRSLERGRLITQGPCNLCNRGKESQRSRNAGKKSRGIDQREMRLDGRIDGSFHEQRIGQNSYGNHGENMKALKDIELPMGRRFSQGRDQFRYSNDVEGMFSYRWIEEQIEISISMDSHRHVTYSEK